LLLRHAEYVTEVELASNGVLVDFDTPYEAPFLRAAREALAFCLRS